MQAIRQLNGVNAGLPQVTVSGLQSVVSRAIAMRRRSLVELWQRSAESLRTVVQVRAAVRELNELDDRLLADIGLQRCDIRPVVMRRVRERYQQSS